LKVNKRLLFLSFIFLNFVFGQGVLTLQQHLEDTVQGALNKMLGDGKSIVYVSLIAEDEKWQINYTALPQIEGMDVERGAKKQSTIVPGIPSLRFLTDSQGGDSSLPLNYEVVQIPPNIKNKEVIIILDSKIKLGELRGVKLFVTKFLNLDETKGDKLTILKENFSEAEIKGSTSKQKLTSKTSFNWMLVVMLVLGIIVIIAIILLIMRFPKKKRDRELLKDNDSEQEKKKHENPEEEKKIDEDTIKKKEEESKLKIMNESILGNGARYFNFITEENVYKLKFLLQVKIALQQATPKTIAVVMSCLPFKLAASILDEYPIKIQGEIVNNLLVLQHYPEKDMLVLENEIQENIEYLFGGRYRLIKIFEKVTGEDKKRLLKVVEQMYPNIANELSELVVLFEDIMSLDQKVLGRIYGDIDTEVIATSLVHIQADLQRKVMDTLPKGVFAMVDQWLKLKANSASRYDIEQARQKVIGHAQNLVKEGFISLEHER